MPRPRLSPIQQDKQESCLAVLSAPKAEPAGRDGALHWRCAPGWCVGSGVGRGRVFQEAAGKDQQRQGYGGEVQTDRRV